MSVFKVVIPCEHSKYEKAVEIWRNEVAKIEGYVQDKMAIEAYCSLGTDYKSVPEQTITFTGKIPKERLKKYIYRIKVAAEKVLHLVTGWKNSDIPVKIYPVKKINESESEFEVKIPCKHSNFSRAVDCWSDEVDKINRGERGYIFVTAHCSSETVDKSFPNESITFCGSFPQEGKKQFEQTIKEIANHVIYGISHLIISDVSVKVYPVEVF